MDNSNNNSEKRTLVNINANYLGKLTLSMPISAMTICVVWSMLFAFEGSTSSHCKVVNVLPTVSAAIALSPQCYIWRTLIALHTSPRILFAMTFYRWHLEVDVGKDQYKYRRAVQVAIGTHILEILCLLWLSMVSSLENGAVHENTFIVFMACSWTYMFLVPYLSNWARSHGNARHAEKYIRAHKVRKYLCIINVVCWSIAVCLYFHHNWYCQPYVYSVFALFEYLTIATNIGWHGSFLIDCADVTSIAVLRTDLLMKLQ